jgi:uncharacterized membrane protein
MERGIGGFVAEGAVLVSVASYRAPSPEVSDELVRRVNARFGLGKQRTIEQDAGFGFRQVVDIALKALSPGVNDTTTALIGVDHLGALLAQLADRCLASPLRSDDGQVRVVAVRPSFTRFVATAFDQIRSAANGNAAVYLRLLTALNIVAQRTHHPKRRRVLYQQAELIGEAAARTLATEYERQQVRTRLAEVQSRLS